MTMHVPGSDQRTDLRVVHNEDAGQAPEHALLQRLQAAPDDDAHTADYAELLFEQAMLAEGGHLDDPAAFIARMNRLLVG